jgi:hydrogenase maturation protease
VSPFVIGLGNELRGDDAAGILAARAVRERRPALEVHEEQGNPSVLLDVWAGADRVVVVDAVRSGDPAGTIHRFDSSTLAGVRGSTSTHGVGLAEVVALARALDRLPRRLVVLAVEGRSFGAGAPLSDEVRASLPRLVDAVLAECEG